MTTDTIVGNDLEQYKWGFSKPENYVFKSRKGLSHEIVEEISQLKGEPQWMRDFRHKSLDLFLKRPMPTWGGDLSGIDLDDIYYYIKPTEKAGETWEDLPEEIKDTFDKLGIPEAERKDRIVKALDSFAGNQTRTAGFLGISRKTLLTLLDRYGIARPRKR